MTDLQNPIWIYLKGILFLLLLSLCAFLLFLRDRHWITALLLGGLIWSAARFYYFMFYVIEKYVDDRYRFSGIGSFLVYVWKGKRGTPPLRAQGRKGKLFMNDPQ